MNNTSNIRLYAFILSCAALLGACSDNNYSGESKVAPLIYGEVLPYEAGSTDLNWHNSQQLGIYMVDSRTKGRLYRNVPHTASATGNSFVKLFSKQSMYYPDSGESVDLIFYAPYANVSDEDEITVSTLRQDKPADIDLLYAVAENHSKTNSYVPFEIKHKLAKLLFMIEGEINSKPVVVGGLNMKLLDIVTDARFNVRTGELREGSQKSAVALQENKGAPYQASAIVIPAASAAGIKLEVTVINSGKTFVAGLDSQIDGFKPSTQYVFRMKLTDIGLEVTLESVIEDWDNEEDEDITVNKDQK